MTLSLPVTTEIYLCDPEGVRIECLDYVTSYAYTLVANDISPGIVKLPAKFDRNGVKLDNIIEIWRGYSAGTLHLDYCGFVRSWTYATDNNGVDYTVLYTSSANDLLTRRIITGYAGSTQADKTDYSDDMLKEIVEEQLGATAGAGRSLASVGGGFTIQADLGDGASITKAFAYKNVFEVCQEIAAASAQAGTRLYFNVVPLVSSGVTGKLAFEFRTYTDQLGSDRTADSDTPIFIGNEWGNLSRGAWDADYQYEVNWVSVLGQGEGIDRETSEQEDTTRQGLSIWNLREGAKDARHVDLGDTSALTAEGYTYLDEHKPDFRFAGDVIETPAFRYGRDWKWGDRVTVSYAGIQKDGMINRVSVSRDEDGLETITAKVELDE